MKRATLMHPKTLALAEASGMSRRDVIGLLTLLWDFTGQYAPDGAVGRYTNQAIAKACDIQPEQADEMVGHLVRTGWIDETADQSIRLVIHDWEDHCEQWVRKRLTREGREFVHPERISRTDIQNGYPKRQPSPSLAMPSLASGECEAHSLGDPPKPAESPSARIRSADVDAIYSAYPRHVGKAAARKAIAKALKARDPAWLLDRVKAFAVSPAGQAGAFTPHPATWFNGGRYDDDPAEWQRERLDPARNGHTGQAGERRDQRQRRECPENIAPETVPDL